MKKVINEKLTKMIEKIANTFRRKEFLLRIRIEQKTTILEAKMNFLFAFLILKEEKWQKISQKMKKLKKSIKRFKKESGDYRGRSRTKNAAEKWRR